MEQPSQPPLDYSAAELVIKAARIRKRAGQDIKPPNTLTKEYWPPDYARVLAWRQTQLARMQDKPSLVVSARQYYRDHPVAFINHWCNTYDPRNAAQHKPVWFPLIMFPKQAELVEFVQACIEAEQSGLVEKSRDMGASWICLSVTCWLFLFWDQVAIGWGSRKREQVDRIGDQSCLFEKIRMQLRNIPDVLRPRGWSEDNMTYMRCVNPETGSTITGEIGDDIGRGGRTLIYFVDEAAHLEHPEAVEASLMSNTRVRMDISSVSGMGNVFHRKRDSGQDWVRGKTLSADATNVFVLDWSDHPDRSQAWYDEQKAKTTNQGLAHVFAREVARDYAASVEGVIVPADWVVAAIDADKKLGLDLGDTGKAIAGLDVADSGLDRNALTLRKGIKLLVLDEWGARDTGATARRAIGQIAPYAPCELQYDAIGVGAGVKAETNRLKDDNLLPQGIKLVPWMAGATPLDPYKHVIPGDTSSPMNRNFYANFKAQAWWDLRRRFEATYRAVTEQDYTWDEDELIVLPSTLPLLRKLQKELSQPVATRTSNLKLMVDKSPEGTMSPNLADALVMAYFPNRLRSAAAVASFSPIILSAD